MDTMGDLISHLSPDQPEQEVAPIPCVSNTQGGCQSVIGPDPSAFLDKSAQYVKRTNAQIFKKSPSGSSEGL